MNFQILLCLPFLICFPATVLGFINPDSEYNYQYMETTDPITINGILSEEIWSRLPVADGFWMSYPVDDRRVENEMLTEVRVTFDKQYLYIGAVCYGTEDYVIKTLKRDAEF